MKRYFLHQTTAAMLTAVTAVSTLGLIATGTAKAAPPMQMAPGMVVIPRDVLIFPANVSTGSGDSAPSGPMTSQQKLAQEIVTDAFRDYLSKSDIGVVVYNRRLPSVQRAVSEGLKADEAMMGPGDDERKALRFAQIAGAAEYITLDVTNYKYDSATRTASFNVNVFRNSVDDDGAPLATIAKPASGAAPADVSLPRQEGSALARAAAQVAEETFQDLYPQVASLNAAKAAKMSEMKMKMKKK